MKLITYLAITALYVTSVLGGGFIHSSNSIKWDEAREFCSNSGKRMVSITDAQKQAEVESYLSQSELGPGQPVWLSLRNDHYGYEGVWAWELGPVAEYFNWEDGSPYDQDTNHCVIMWNPTAPGKWQDHYCEPYRYGAYALCED